jgi:hypothetical protein
MKYARVKAADLRFHLFERSIHPELFEVLRRAEIEEAGYFATLVISGQSHVLSVRSGGETIAEVVARADASLPRIGARSAVQLGRCGREEVRRAEGPIKYAASVRVEKYVPAEYRRLTGHILAANPFERLKVFFDDEAAGGVRAVDDAGVEEIPFALMDFRHSPRKLEVASVHACPHELTIVHVETRVEVA